MLLDLFLVCCYVIQMRLIVLSGTLSTLYIFYTGPSCVVTAIAGIVSAGDFLGSLTMAAKACPEFIVFLVGCVFTIFLPGFVAFFSFPFAGFF